MFEKGVDSHPQRAIMGTVRDRETKPEGVNMKQTKAQELRQRAAWQKLTRSAEKSSQRAVACYQERAKELAREWARVTLLSESDALELILAAQNEGAKHTTSDASNMTHTEIMRIIGRAVSAECRDGGYLLLHWECGLRGALIDTFTDYCIQN